MGYADQSNNWKVRDTSYHSKPKPKEEVCDFCGLPKSECMKEKGNG